MGAITITCWGSMNPEPSDTGSSRPQDFVHVGSSPESYHEIGEQAKAYIDKVVAKLVEMVEAQAQDR